MVIPFTYGAPFTGGFRLTGSSGESGGTFDFLNTALVTGILLPEGAVLTAASGTSYPVSPVPEPPVWLLMGMGGAVVGWAGRRRTV